MKTDDFNFDLPESQIAQFPPAVRGASRLFVLGSAGTDPVHSMTADLGRFIEPGTVMVFNDSKVRKARLIGVAADTNSTVEFLLLSPLPAAADRPERHSGDSAGLAASADSRFWLAMCGKSKRQRPGRSYVFPGGVTGSILELREDLRVLEFDTPIGEEYLEKNGHIPLPPYIRRDDDSSDARRYQTVYAREVGSAACPTAGLHFTEEILADLAARGIRIEWVTLHVGLGTFLPVRTEEVELHKMHEESYTVPARTAEAIAEAKREGRKVLAVGTTSLRTLESACVDGVVQPGSSSTSIFIYPGYRFRIVDQLFTNFHTPKSTLLMLVCAFAGRERMLKAYGEAVAEGYRFFSYGDAMLILGRDA